MASRTTTKKTASEQLQDEGTPNPNLALLRTPGKVSNPDRLRFIARLRPLQTVFESGISEMNTEALDALADFIEYVTSNFAASDAARAKVEALSLDEHLNLTMAYAERLGESLGSSN